ncbi:DoxX family protein [Mycobacterium barrassiae]|nr:DoxX family protein [Mycobacterium barrassiae]MCV7303095.1 DoxX family protein [Mycobacterium barrassiae]
MTTNLDARLASYSSPFLSIFRIVFGLLYTMHGAQKLFDWPAPMPVPIETGSWPMWWAGLLEFVLGILITLGLFTRIAAFVASGQMAVAYFWMHWPPLEGEPTSFWPLVNGGEMAVMYCFAFLLLAGMGAGAWSIDARRRAGAGGVAPGRVVTGTAAPTGRGGLLGRFRR